MIIVQFSRTPTPCLSTSKVLPPLDLGRPISNDLPPLLSPNNNKSNKRKHDPMIFICYKQSSLLSKDGFTDVKIEWDISCQ